MPQLQFLDVYQGENRTLALAARDNSNNPVDLTGQAVTWGVSFPPYDPSISQALLTKTGTVTNAPQGLYTVALTPDDTASLTDGNYTHQAFTTAAADGSIAYVTYGTFRVRRHIWPQ